MTVGTSGCGGGKVIADQKFQKPGGQGNEWVSLVYAEVIQDDGRTWEGEGDYETGDTVFENERKAGR